MLNDVCKIDLKIDVPGVYTCLSLCQWRIQKENTCEVQAIRYLVVF